MSERERLKRTGSYPLIQSLLEWRLGAEVSKAVAACDEILQFSQRGIVADASMDLTLEACESPAERQFILGLAMLDGWTLGPDVGRPMISIEYPDGVIPLMWLKPQVEYFENACPQCGAPAACAHPRVAIARVDFLLTIPRCLEPYHPGASIAIEIDGHDYHDRTKEQAARDRSRDRLILMGETAPNHIVRFTAAEVYADPQLAFVEARAVLLRTWMSAKDAIGKYSSYCAAVQQEIEEERRAVPLLPPADQAPAGEVLQ